MAVADARCFRSFACLSFCSCLRISLFSEDIFSCITVYNICSMDDKLRTGTRRPHSTNMLEDVLVAKLILAKP